MKNPQSILITGGSSGIGEALARHYAKPGVHLTLTGRNAERLEAVAAACRNAGATAVADQTPVTDAAGMAALIARAEKDHPFDLVVANAGISAGTGGDTEPADQTRRIFGTNIDGVTNTVLPAVDAMMARPKRETAPRGQIAIVSSIAGFRGFPGAPAYCASKAAVRVWGEGLRGMVHRHGIQVNVICPGYVRTRMTASNKFYMPFLMNGEKAAKIIARRLERNSGRIVFPRRLYALLLAVNALPYAITEPLLGRLPAKGSE